MNVNTQIVLQIAVVAGLALLLVKFFLAMEMIRRHRTISRQARQHLHDSTPLSLTIAQPVLSGDPLLSEKLAENIRSLPTTVRFLWLVDRSDSEGCRIAARLAADSPNVTVVTCDDAPDGVNPKTFKLVSALELTDTEYFGVLDDDTTLTAESMWCALVSMKHCDLYTGLPWYQSDDRFWSRLLAHFVNNNAVLTYLPLLVFSPPVSINGMFYVLRANAWKQTGGFETIAGELCDDYAVRRQAGRHNWRVIQGIASQTVQTSVQGPSHYVSMMHRWMVFATVLLRDQSGFLKLLLGIFLAVPPLLLWCVIILGVTNPNQLLTLAEFLVIRFLLLLQIHRAAFGDIMQSTGNSTTAGRFSFWLSLLSEMLQPLHSLHGFFVRRIRWRSRLIQVQRDGTFRLEPERERERPA